MKLPRWLVLSLLSVSVLAVLGAGAWWWVMWPERKMRHLKSLLGAGELQQANSMIDNPEYTEPSYELILGTTCFWKNFDTELLTLSLLQS